MPHRLEIALKANLIDAEGQGVIQKARNYFGLELQSVRTINILTIDAELSEDQLGAIRTDIFILRSIGHRI